MENEEYLGDGLYASFDGFQIKLRAPRWKGDHEVYMEGPVLAAFLAYVDRLKKRVPEATATAETD